MKVIVSSLTLANVLSEIDLERKPVSHVSVESFILTIESNSKSVKLVCEPSVLRMHNHIINQENVRWDWIKNLVSKVDEQPIVLDIKESGTNVIFQY